MTSKRRVHFLDFMLDVHQRMHRCRQRGISGELMVSTVTDEILEEGWLLCFDEMQVTRVFSCFLDDIVFLGWAVHELHTGSVNIPELNMAIETAPPPVFAHTQEP